MTYFCFRLYFLTVLLSILLFSILQLCYNLGNAPKEMFLWLIVMFVLIAAASTAPNPSTMKVFSAPVAAVCAHRGPRGTAYVGRARISGTNGSGTVFFSGCNLHCAFCQNYEISCLNKGTEITIERLRAIYFDLIEQGAHNINLVTPTHFTEAVLSSLQEPLPVPVVYNTSGFETLDTVRKLKDKVQIWLPDLKYSDDLAAIKYSNAPNYFATATAAIKAMYKQVGPYKIDDSGRCKERSYTSPAAAKYGR